MWLNWSRRAHRGLRTWILYILKDTPKNGVEIMDSMETMSNGRWRPSPGSVYPMLESMVKEGLIKEVGDKKYELTESGRQEAEWPLHFRLGGPRTVEETLTTISSYISYLEDLSKSQKTNLDAESGKVKELISRLEKLQGG